MQSGCCQELASEAAIHASHDGRQARCHATIAGCDKWLRESSLLQREALLRSFAIVRSVTHRNIVTRYDDVFVLPAGVCNFLLLLLLLSTSTGLLVLP